MAGMIAAGTGEAKGRDVQPYVIMLIFHIASGSIALVAGTAALLVRKGGRLHGRAGAVFAAAMLVMLGTGTVLAIVGPSRFVAVNAVFAIYLVATSWAAARRRTGEAGRFERLAVAVPLACAAADVMFGLDAMADANGRLDGFPAGGYFGFAAFAAVAVGLDLNFILRGKPDRVRRLSRHLWRMCVAFSMTAGSLFLGQQQVFPHVLRGSSIMFLPAVAPFSVMLFWLVRLRVGRSRQTAETGVPEPSAIGS
jgi:uncharacterized membrane protein